ncbi:hypothetical protein FOA43_000064 [Brettanomyces nanus]|uniref:Autophagy-related protein 27 n=1 Tax=Eeniella nana TaxID=13502 RepID=A0A875RWF2_EENNA|nr:uncharacterized protein FOA43_000064 [Brettanomyces nanus]QPG72763.1 hypothetical protein FOA43_000064 [Brettanomyces nanus]
MHGSLIVLSLLVSTVFSIDLSNKAFKEYTAIKNIAGVHNIEKTKSTPPSTTTQKWYINMVDPEQKDLPKDIEDVKGCPSGSQICGLTTVKLPEGDDKEVTTEIFAFSSKLVPQFDDDDEHDELTVKLSGANWGDKTLEAVLNLKCSPDKKEDSLDVVFDYTTLKINWENNAFCKDASAEKPHGKHHKDDHRHGKDRSWGLFTWFFILLVLALAGYIIGQAWVNTSRVGNSGEFLNELGDATVETAGKVPEFLKQVVSKVTGGGDRGGYSAV